MLDDVIEKDELKDFKSYLEMSLRDPFVLNLNDSSLMEVINACVKVKSNMHPSYGDSISGLIYNLKTLESQYSITLQPIQVTDIPYSKTYSYYSRSPKRT